MNREQFGLSSELSSGGNLSGQKMCLFFLGVHPNISDPGDHVHAHTDKQSLIRKIDSMGNVTTLAGKAGSAGSTNGQGISATFNQPTGLAVDSSGNVYVADQYNHMIRKIE